MLSSLQAPFHPNIRACWHLCVSARQPQIASYGDNPLGTLRLSVSVYTNANGIILCTSFYVCTA